jgi:hypothetical protein
MRTKKKLEDGFAALHRLKAMRDHGPIRGYSSNPPQTDPGCGWGDRDLIAEAIQQRDNIKRTSKKETLAQMDENGEAFQLL